MSYEQAWKEYAENWLGWLASQLGVEDFSVDDLEQGYLGDDPYFD